MSSILFCGILLTSVKKGIYYVLIIFAVVPGGPIQVDGPVYSRYRQMQRCCPCPKVCNMYFNLFFFLLNLYQMIGDK